MAHSIHRLEKMQRIKTALNFIHADTINNQVSIASLEMMAQSCALKSLKCLKSAQERKPKQHGN